MKTKLFLLAAVMFLVFTVSAFPQAAYTVSQETLDRVACCGLAEPTGAIAFTAVADTPPTVTGTITLRYNLPITNGGNELSATDRVRVTAVNLAGTLLTPQPTFVADNDGSNGRIVIAVPAGYTYPNTINVFNVRVNVSASSLCGATDTTVTANASSTGNRLTIGETVSVTLVKGVAKGLKDPVVTVAPSGSVVSINASNGTVTGTATIRFDENFFTAFGVVGVFPEPNRTQQTLIRLTVSPIPTGVRIVFPGAAGSFGTANSAGTFSGSPVQLDSSTTAQNVYYVLTAATNPAGIDSFTVSPTVSVITTVFPLAPSTISVSGALAPITTTPATIDRFPLYIEGCETAAVNIVSVSGVLNTILLVPYATTEQGYNTAISVANTTKDPGTVAMANFTTAIPQTGKITIYFYPKNGATIAPWVSTSYPNLYGLDSAGKLPPGGTFVALLTALLPDTVDEFGGYVFIVTDFTNAHSEYFVSNFLDFTHGALALVVSDLNRAASGAGRTQEQGLNQ
jgi:hypothetical protein